MEPYAEASCVLKVNVHCQACKMKMLEVLGSICGKYNVDINSEEGLARVFAVVDPNLLLNALARTGYHAELKWVKLRHPELSRSYCYNNNDYDSCNYGYGFNYGAIDDPYSGRRALPYPLSYVGYQPQHYSTTTSISPYYHGSNPYHYGSALPPARYVPSYPPKECDPSSDACRRPRPFHL